VLRSLRELSLTVAMEKQGIQPLMQLLSSALQGCLLKIDVVAQGHGLWELEQLKSAYTALVAEKGSRNVPLLHMQERPEST
jgi:hypothetical protein